MVIGRVRHRSRVTTLAPMPKWLRIVFSILFACAMGLLVFSILFVLAALSGSLRAEDAKPAPLATTEELTKQVAEQKQENERLLRLLNAYQQNYFACEAQAIGQKALAAQRPPEQPRSPALPAANRDVPSSGGKEK